ncbi:MAG: hypothetical protein RQ875_00025 [Vicingaceae bacterium]|nr:hypothetical protein [Vicingaceae bacterium]
MIINLFLDELLDGLTEKELNQLSNTSIKRIKTNTALIKTYRTTQKIPSKALIRKNLYEYILSALSKNCEDVYLEIYLTSEFAKIYKLIFKGIFSHAQKRLTKLTLVIEQMNILEFKLQLKHLQFLILTRNTSNFNLELSTQLIKEMEEINAEVIQIYKTKSQLLKLNEIVQQDGVSEDKLRVFYKDLEIIASNYKNSSSLNNMYYKGLLYGFYLIYVKKDIEKGCTVFKDIYEKLKIILDYKYKSIELNRLLISSVNNYFLLLIKLHKKADFFQEFRLFQKYIPKINDDYSIFFAFKIKLDFVIENFIEEEFDSFSYKFVNQYSNYKKHIKIVDQMIVERKLAWLFFYLGDLKNANYYISSIRHLCNKNRKEYQLNYITLTFLLFLKKNNTTKAAQFLSNLLEELQASLSVEFIIQLIEKVLNKNYTKKRLVFLKFIIKRYNLPVSDFELKCLNHIDLDSY